MSIYNGRNLGYFEGEGICEQRGRDKLIFSEGITGLKLPDDLQEKDEALDQLLKMHSRMLYFYENRRKFSSHKDPEIKHAKYQMLVISILMQNGSVDTAIIDPDIKPYLPIIFRAIALEITTLKGTYFNRKIGRSLMGQIKTRNNQIASLMN